MSSDTTKIIDQAAACLAEGYESGSKVAGLPSEAMPISDETGFRIQLKVAELLGKDIGGYKVSNSGRSPAAGIIYADAIEDSPAQWPRKAGLRVETEIAAIVGSRGPSEAGRTLDDDEAAALISSFAAGIEIIESRYIAQGRLLSPGERHADQLSSGGYVVGPKLEDWSSVDLSSRHMKMWVGDRLLFDETRSHPSEGPLRSISWLAGYLPQFGLALEPGHVVTTGSYSGVHMVIPGDVVKVEFEGFGAVEVGLGTEGHW